jgi:hypothetical protein
MRDIGSLGELLLPPSVPLVATTTGSESPMKPSLPMSP